MRLKDKFALAVSVLVLGSVLLAVAAAHEDMRSNLEKIAEAMSAAPAAIAEDATILDWPS